MEVIWTLLLFALAAAPLILIGSWFAARGHRGLGSLVSGGGASWWRSQMPWPEGVQESDDVHWHFADREPARQRPMIPATAGTDESPAAAPAIDRTKVESHVRIRRR